MKRLNKIGISEKETDQIANDIAAIIGDLRS